MTRKQAVAYFRTSSASGVGEDKDTLPRQREAVTKYALLENLEIVAEYYDANVRGTVKIQERPEFAKMLQFIKRQGVSMILVETANRFSRDLGVQIMGYDFLREMGINIVPVDAPAHFLDDDNPAAELMRNLIGAFSMYEKKSLVKKMGDARARIRAKGERAEGRIPPPPEAIALAKKLRAEGMALRAIGEELSKAGYRVIQKDKKGVAQVTDRIFQAQSVKNMIETE